MDDAEMNLLLKNVHKFMGICHSPFAIKSLLISLLICQEKLCKHWFYAHLWKYYGYPKYLYGFYQPFLWYKGFVLDFYPKALFSQKR